MRFFVKPLATIRLIMPLLCGALALNLASGLRGAEAGLEGEADVQPIPTNRGAPDYHSTLRRNGIPGGVYVNFVVTKEGKVVEAHAVSETNAVFGKEAVEAVAKWEFKPGLKKGQPADFAMSVPVLFFQTRDPSKDGQQAKVQMGLSGFAPKSLPKTPERLRYDQAPSLRTAFTPVSPWVNGEPTREGEADLAFVINPQGQVAEVKIVSATSEAFGQAAQAALECWEYTPAKLDGNPTSAIGRKIIKFDLYMPKKSAELRLLREIKRGKTHLAKASELDALLKPVLLQKPHYPLALARNHPHGTAVIECIVAKDGNVCLPRIIKASEGAFGWAAATAVGAWRFDPPRVNGEPVDVKVRIPFDF